MVLSNRAPYAVGIRAYQLLLGAPIRSLDQSSRLRCHIQASSKDCQLEGGTRITQCLSEGLDEVRDVVLGALGMNWLANFRVAGMLGLESALNLSQLRRASTPLFTTGPSGNVMEVLTGTTLVM